MLNNSQQRLAAIQLALLLQITQRIIRLQQLVALHGLEFGQKL